MFSTPNDLQRSWTCHYKWAPCIEICVPCLNICDTSLGFVYLYLAISVHVTTFGSMIVHWDMTGMPHYHSFHIDYSKRAPFPSWTITPM
jgi:hypothetical protein